MEQHTDQQETFVEEKENTISTPQADDISMTKMAEDVTADLKLSFGAKLWMMVKFVLPLIFALMVPSVCEQILYRAITSTAKEQMTEPLASFGLAYYIARIFTTLAIEFRHVGVTLVTNKVDHTKMTKLSVAVGVILSFLLLLLGVTPASDWLFRVVHKQSDEVTDMTVSIMLYLTPLPLLEAIASYYEGVLIHQRLTALTGAARLAECGFQIGLALLFVLTPIHSHIQPALIPVIAMCSAVFLRLILMVVFWFAAARQKMSKQQIFGEEEKSNNLTVGRALLFWIPLAFVRLFQVTNQPTVNLVVSRVVSEREGPHAAAQTAAVLTMIYPLVRFLHTYLNDIRSVIPVFRQKTDDHDVFSFKVLGAFSGLFIMFTITLNVILLMIPQVVYFIMNTIMGLTDELATLSVFPLRFYCLVGIPVGIRAYCSGILITWKKTAYLTPGAVLGLGGLVVGLVALPYTSMRGEVMGLLCLLISYLLEMFAAILAVLWQWHQYRKRDKK